MKKNETHQEQVMRVISEMVASGEMLTKLSASGELLYTLAETPTATKQIKKCRSAAAKKAWKTRRLKMKLKPAKTVKLPTVNKAKLAKKIVINATEEQAKKRLSEIAKKAWVTRRLKAKGNPTKREERLERAKEMVTGKTQVKYKVRKETIRNKPDYVSFDQHLERAWEAYEDSVKKALLRRSAAK